MRRLADPSEEPDLDLLAPERPPALESITERAVAEALVPAIPRRPRAATRRWMLRVAAAAVVLATVGIGMSVWVTQRTQTTHTYVTAVGEFHRISLPDGSAVSLNTDTKIEVSYSGADRRVELLRGEAQFEVAHDADRPFVVSANSTHVSVLGTAFVVRKRSASSLDVLVTEGRVAIDSAPATVLSGGQMALIRDGRLTTLTVDDMSRRTAWTEGMLVFSGETLSEAVAEFNRYNRRQLVITDAELASKTIGGAFKATNPDRFATALKKMFRIEVRAHDDASRSEIRLSSGP